jgi:hypothetical protein
MGSVPKIHEESPFKIKKRNFHWREEKKNVTPLEGVLFGQNSTQT